MTQSQDACAQFQRSFHPFLRSFAGAEHFLLAENFVDFMSIFYQLPKDHVHNGNTATVMRTFLHKSVQTAIFVGARFSCS